MTIIRAPPIGASYQDPFPGWIEPYHGTTSLFGMVGTGRIKFMLLGNNYDELPVDILVNHLILAGAYKPRDPGCTIVHTVRNDRKSLKLVFDLVASYYKSKPVKLP